MSPKRPSIAAARQRASDQETASVALQRDHVTALPEPPSLAPGAGGQAAEVNATPPAPALRAQSKPASLGRRDDYHASIYLPREASFALREIQLALRYPKPHDVMLEAMAELFERYNKRQLAQECRSRMTKRKD